MHAPFYAPAFTRDEKCWIKGTHVFNVSVDLASSLTCKFLGMHSYGDIINSVIDIWYRGPDCKCIYSAGNVVNCHINLGNGDPRRELDASLRLDSWDKCTGIQALGSIDSCSIHTLLGEDICGIYSENGNITNVRVSDVDGSGNVTIFRLNTEKKEVRNAYLFNIDGDTVVLAQGGNINNDTVYALNVEGVEGCHTYTLSDQHHLFPRDISDLKWILLRLETNLAMQLNVEGDEFNCVGILISYLTHCNLGKMPHGFEYYQNSVMEMGYSNSDSLVSNYDLSRINSSYNYSDSEVVVPPAAALTFKDHNISSSNLVEIDESPSIIKEMDTDSMLTGGDYSANAQLFYNNDEALKEGVYSYIDEEYRSIIPVYVQDNKLRCGARFLIPQDETTMNEYFLGLVESVNKAAKNHGIGNVPISFWYEYPEYGSLKSYPGSFETERIALVGDGETTTIPQGVARVRPIEMSTAVTSPTVENGTTYLSKGSSGCFATAGDTYYMISHGHSRLTEQNNNTMYQSGLKLNQEKKEVPIQTLGDDKIGTIKYVIAPVVGKTAETDAALIEIENNLVKTDNQKQSLYKMYSTAVDGQTIYVNVYELYGYKTLADIKKTFKKGETRIDMFGVSSSIIFAVYHEVKSVTINGAKVNNCIFVKNSDNLHVISGDSGGPVCTVENDVYKLIGLNCGFVKDGNTFFSVVVPISVVLEQLEKGAELGDSLELVYKKT
jgi:hypothetical protein